MKHFDAALENIDLDLKVLLEDMYNIWTWHPGMG